MMLSDNDLFHLRLRLLHFFAEDGARQMPDLLYHPAFRHFPRRALQKLVYALAHAGLLDQWGSTKGCFYHTNALGRLVLEHLQTTLPRNPDRSAESLVS